MAHSTLKRSRPTAESEKCPFEQVSNLEGYRMDDMPGSEVYYVPSFISGELSDNWYSALLKLDRYQPKLKVYGREVTQSRKIAAYSTDPELVLKYSGQIVDMKYEYPSTLRDIQDQVERRLGVKFNHVMLNLYEDGTVYIGNHRDNLENQVIASLSLGAPRTFIMTHDKRKPTKTKSKAATSSESVMNDGGPKPKRKRLDTDDAVEGQTASSAALVYRKSWLLDHGSLVVMQGETQRNWKHEIPKEPKVKAGRISLTFRQLVNS